MRRALSAIALLLYGTPAWADDAVHGRVELGYRYSFENSGSLSALLGEETRNDALGDLRLTWEPRWGAWDFAIHYQLAADAGDTPALAARRNALGILPSPPPTTWWNLSDTFVDNGQVTATQRIDRLSIGYTGSHFVLRFGRQALTWGSGLVFHPMDLFDPFSPTAIDTEYKPGTDMLYAQWLFDDGSDLQFVMVFRPTRVGGEPASNAGSVALHYRATLAGLQTTWLVARDRRDWVAAAGIDGALGGATWNVEVVPTFVHDGPALTSALANISDAATIFGRDATMFAEYYRNGFGLSGRHYALTDLPAPLIDRLLRGQVYDTGRDYLAAGVMLQWTPLLQIAPTAIVNLDDGSVYAVAQTTWSLKQNLNLVAGVQLPIGPAKTEFGGIPLAGDAPPYDEQPGTLYAQLRQYF